MEPMRKNQLSLTEGSLPMLMIPCLVGILGRSCAALKMIVDSAIARATDQAARCTAKLSLGREHGFTCSRYIKTHDKSWSVLERLRFGAFWNAPKLYQKNVGLDVDLAHFAVIYWFRNHLNASPPENATR